MTNQTSPALQTLPPVQALWVGSELRLVEQISMHSFLEQGHPYHLYVYGPVRNVPQGVQIMDANEIIPEQDVFCTDHRGYTPFSDWFRWELMNRKGGIYVDTDIVAIRPFEFNEDVVACYEENPDYQLEGKPVLAICPAVIKFPQKHPLIPLMLERCRNPRADYWSEIRVPNRKNQKNDFSQKLKKAVTEKNLVAALKYSIQYIGCISSYLRDFLLIRHNLFPFFHFYRNSKNIRIKYDMEFAGPTALDTNNPHAVLHRLSPAALEELQKKTKPAEAFFPITWRDIRTIYDNTYADEKDLKKAFPNSYCIHIWTHIYSMWKIKEEKNSLIGNLAKKYDLEVV